MSGQRTENAARAKTRREKAAEAASDDVQAKMADIMRFVRGQHHQPDADIQMDGLVQDIRLLMDDELINALETAEAHYVYDDRHVHANAAVEVWPIRNLLNQLRDLQKTRLRDALARLTGQPN